jgi:hypothetical protein
MFNKVKYVRTKDDIIIIFPEYYQHSNFKFMKPVSAGFINFYVKNNRIDVDCYGDSVSLDLKSNPEEDRLLARKQILKQID